MYPGAICHANVAQQFQILGSKGFFGMPEYAAPTELEKLFGELLLQRLRSYHYCPKQEPKKS